MSSNCNTFLQKQGMVLARTKLTSCSGIKLLQSTLWYVATITHAYLHKQKQRDKQRDRETNRERECVTDG